MSKKSSGHRRCGDLRGLSLPRQVSAVATMPATASSTQARCSHSFSAILASAAFRKYIPASSGLPLPGWPELPPRSEEHTSELQSQSNLVCRLLLEKKKKASNSSYTILLTLKQSS